MAAKPQVGFLGCARMRARPVGPAESSALHNFARSGPTKEAHRRAMNQSDGLLRSVAGQGHGRFLPVTLPRGASDQGKRAEAGDHRSPTPRGTHQGRGWGTHQGRDQGTLGGPIRGGPGGREIAVERSRRAARNCTGNSATGTVRGPKSASARPGPCTRPRSADALARREYHPARQAPASRSFVLGRRRRPAGTARGPSWRPAGRSTLTPGRAGWSRGHGSGVPPSAQRHPPGEGATACGLWLFWGSCDGSVGGLSCPYVTARRSPTTVPAL